MMGKKNTKHILLSLLISSSCFLAGCFISCTDNDPPFSNLTKLNNGHRYVAYLAPLNQTEKLDTVTFSFKYNSSKVASILVEATLDSGKTWILVADITPNSSNGASVQWVPKDAAQTTFNFFGIKECYLKISDQASGEFLTSDTFLIIGAIPVVLISPKGGEVYRKTDSIKVLYSHNQDRSGNITVCAKADPDTGNWARSFVSDTTVRISQTLPIKNFSTTFIPEMEAQSQPDKFDFTYPLLILLADYGENGMRILSGEITIQ